MNDVNFINPINSSQTLYKWRHSEKRYLQLLTVENNFLLDIHVRDINSR